MEQTGDKSEHLAPNERVKDLVKLCRFMFVMRLSFYFCVCDSCYIALNPRLVVSRLSHQILYVFFSFFSPL